MLFVPVVIQSGPDAKGIFHAMLADGEKWATEQMSSTGGNSGFAAHRLNMQPEVLIVH